MYDTLKRERAEQMDESVVRDCETCAYYQPCRDCLDSGSLDYTKWEPKDGASRTLRENLTVETNAAGQGMTATLKLLAEQEHQQSYEKYPGFHSMHEAFGVILEEIMETKEAVEALESTQWDLFSLVRQEKKLNANRSMLALLEMIEDTATNAAKEAIQVAAMCRKTVASLSETPDCCTTCSSITDCECNQQ